MTRPPSVPEDLGAHFSIRAAREQGVGRSRTRHPDLVRPFHGTRSLSRPLTIDERVAAYAPRLPAHGFFSHSTAAALWGLPLPPFVDARLHVSYPHGRRAVRTTGVVGHHLVMRDEELTLLGGIPVTTPERTWCDLAGMVGFEDLIAAGDRVVWHRDRLASLEALAELARRHPGRRGRAVRLAALNWICDRSDSPPESVLRVRFIRAGLPHPVVNVDVFDEHGTFVGRPDLAFPDYRELVDYEGDGHRTSRSQWLSDLARVPRFEAIGWHTTRAAGPDLADGSRRLILLVATNLRDKGWRGELTI